MRDIMDCRDWVENHDDFTGEMDRGLGKVMVAFRYLARFNFDAPWTKQTGAKQVA